MHVIPHQAVRRHPRLRAAVIVAAIVAAVGIPLAVTATFGARTYEMVGQTPPDVGTIIAAVVLEVMVAGSGIVTAGLLGYVTITQRAGRRLTPTDAQRRAVRWAEVSAPLWCLSAFGLTLVSAAEGNGLSTDRIASPMFAELFLNTVSSQAWAIVSLAAGIVWMIILFSKRWWAFTIGWLLTIVATIPPVVTGQVSVGAGHDWATDTAILGTLAQTTVVGLLVAFTLLRAGGGSAFPRRFGTLLLAILLVSTIGLAIFFSAGIRSETSWHAVIDGSKVLVVAALIVLVWMPRGSAGRVGTRVATLVLPAAGALIGLDAAANRVPPPRYFVAQSIQENYLGFNLAEPLQWASLLLPARPNILFLVLSFSAIAGYLFCVHRAKARGIAWPRGRTAAWVAGWVVVLAATNTNIGMYSGGMFSVHMVAHMALNMFGPVLLVLGGVTTLALRAFPSAASGAPAGIREWIVEAMRHPLTRIATNPILVLLVFVGSFYVLYFTPLFDTAMRFHWGHQLMNLHFLLIGYLFYWQAIGADRTPTPLPSVGKLGFVFAAMPFHAFFAIIVMGSTDVIAADFYSQLTIPWLPDRLSDQYLGGGIAWAAGELPLIIVVIALGIQWAREDRRTSTRLDRSEDTGRSSALTDYNVMLAELAARDATRPERTP